MMSTLQKDSFNRGVLIALFETKGFRLFLLGCLLGFTALLYVRVRSYEFVNFDDPTFVSENPRVVHGLTLNGIRNSFSTHFFNGPASADYWAPVAEFTHMIDFALYGAWAGGHHLTNLVLHEINILLVFIFFHRVTRQFSWSLLVAAVFALHPLNVESVAWVIDRNGLLACFSSLLCILVYEAYTRTPSLGKYLLVTVFFQLGVMAKTTIVPLPFLLLVLDVWPLRRSISWWKRCLEKGPLVALSLIGCAQTFFYLRNHNGVESAPSSLTLSHSVVSYADYLGNFLFPHNLAVFYPFSNEAIALSRVLMAIFPLTVVTCVAIGLFRKYPGLLIGWLWFLGMLVPVIGLIHGGAHMRADRYLYFPMIGLLLMICAHDQPLTRNAAWITWPFFLCWLLFLVWKTDRQLVSWQNSKTLMEQALRVTPANPFALNNLGIVFFPRASF